ncbi:tetratricopeptide repeat protein [Synechococcus sp. PCC 7502]|uniref:tetratricopeptide repeat protein n=1 Tax=Synechococcus sp. PCC 7502 TaxID=1173263 RepID=UPI00029FD0B2|nr:tetratricopeptide repeat protein [Synechococcus sp. PCC 7502]AFY72358.1 tetratricopeptide repeat protein [Synechococcus sp. PCC 7502]
MLRSLKVTNGWLKRVKQALSRYDFSSQKALAEELEISPRKTSDFFNGKSVDYEVFVAICERLGLEWQKVAKVSPDLIKPKEPKPIKPEVATTISSSIDSLAEPLPQNDGIPKLASSLFRAFDTQPPIAQKKFINVSIPLEPAKDFIDLEQSPELSENSPVNISENLTDLGIEETSEPESSFDNQADQIPAAIAEPSVLPVVDEIHEVTIDEINKSPNDHIETISKEISEEIKEEPEVPTAEEGNQLLEVDLAIDLEIASEPVLATTISPATISQLQDLLGIVTDKQEEVNEVTENLNAPTQELQKSDLPESNAQKTDLSNVSPKNTANILNSGLTNTDDLEPILTAFYDSCKAQNWDLAAAIVNGINLAHIKKTSDLTLLLDLYNQLLPLKWQDGAQKVSDQPSHWQILFNAGMAALYLEKFNDAVTYLETSLAIANSTLLKIKALNALGLVYQAVAQYQSAIKYFQQAQSLAQEGSEHYLQLQALSNLGNAYYSLRQYRTAIAYYLEFLQLANEEEASEVEFSTIGNLGNAYYNLGEYQTAIVYQQKYLEIARAISSSEKEAGCLVSLGFAYYALGLYQTAIEHYQNAKVIADQLSYKRLQVSIFSGLGLSYQALKNSATAVACFHKCLEIARQLGDRSAEVKALYNLRKASLTPSR